MLQNFYLTAQAYAKRGKQIEIFVDGGRLLFQISSQLFAFFKFNLNTGMIRNNLQ